MGAGFLIDTNIAIYFLNGRLTDAARTWLTQAVGAKIQLSVITEMELLGWRQFLVSPEREIIEQFVRDATVLELNRNIVQETIRLRREHSIKLPDAIIAATATIHQLTLVSNNDKDFAAIQGLRYFNPVKLLEINLLQAKALLRLFDPTAKNGPPQRRPYHRRRGLLCHADAGRNGGIGEVRGLSLIVSARAFQSKSLSPKMSIRQSIPVLPV